MESKSTWQFIINPVSGGKKAPQIWNKISQILKEEAIECNHYFTQFSGHAEEIAFDLFHAGNLKFIIIGGDGTANEVLNGIMRSGIRDAKPIVGMIPAGTGNDWVRTIGKLKNINQIVYYLNKESTSLHDIGIVSYGKSLNLKRYFINIAGFGFDGLVASKLMQRKSIFNGTMMQYWIAILESLFFYNQTIMELEVDGKKNKLNLLSGAIGICKYNGGGMMQLPEAIINDGLLNATIICGMPKWKMVMSLPKLKNGSFIKMKEVKTWVGKEFILFGDPSVYFETDGESIGRTPIKISTIQNAFSILKWE